MLKTPKGRSGINNTFGTPGGPSSQWYLKNIVKQKLPFTLLYEGPKGGKTRVASVYFHRLVAPQLVAALTQIWNHARLEVKESVGYDKTTAEYNTLTWNWLNNRGLLNYGGTYNYRPIRGGSSLSTHSYGIAIDMAPGANGLGKTTTSLPDWYIQAFRDHGFFWGGDFKGRKDPMHFQYATGV